MVAPTGPFYPTTSLVAIAWLTQRVVGLSVGQVATTLPAPTAGALSWADQGFLMVTVIGGRPDVDIPVRHSVLQLDAYAGAVDVAGNIATRPPKAKANRLLELVRVATEDPAALYGRAVTLPPAYLGARVLSAYPVTEPSEVADDPSGYARFTMDLALDWVRA